MPVLRDTVEPFWNETDVESCMPLASQVQPADFLDCLRGFLGTTSPAWTYPSGREALKAVLRRSVRQERKLVLVTALTCPVVADVIRNVGGQVHAHDFDDTRGTIRWERIAKMLTHNHAAIIVTHLFGVPMDFRTLLTAARRHGVHVIEDCAHTLGGQIGDQMAGTLGDASFFSFNYDKPISLAGGGALLVNHPDLVPSRNPDDLTVHGEKNELEQYFMFTAARRSRIYPHGTFFRASNRIAQALRLLPRARMPHCRGIGPLRSALGVRQLERYQQIVAIRNKWASLLERWNPDHTWFRGPSVTPAWLRQKLSLRIPSNADSVSQSLRRQGFRVGRFNWPHTLQSPEPNPNADYISKHMLDVPVHQAMNENELLVIQKEFERS